MPPVDRPSQTGSRAPGTGVVSAESPPGLCPAGPATEKKRGNGLIVGEVCGTVWGSVQSMGMAGMKVAVVQPLGGGTRVLAIDRVGACPGEIVLCGNGSRVRDLVLDSRTPVKTVVLGIVDRVDREAP